MGVGRRGENVLSLETAGKLFLNAIIFYSRQHNNTFMTEYSDSSDKPTSEPSKKVPPIIVKPAGDQPGTRTFIEKADPKKK
jgi:hypothetical protein